MRICSGNDRPEVNVEIEKILEKKERAWVKVDIDECPGMFEYVVEGEADPELICDVMAAGAGSFTMN